MASSPQLMPPWASGIVLPLSARTRNISSKLISNLRAVSLSEMQIRQDVDFTAH